MSQGVILDVNLEALTAVTVKLNTLHKSAFPLAVRGALNDAAFDVKQRTMDISANRSFIRRSPNFFRTFTGVNKAQGFNVGQMRSEVGMNAFGKPTAEAAVRHMADQESGGRIREGADYLSGARAGNNQRLVTKSNYFNKNKLVKGSFLKKGTPKSQLVASLFVAVREKKLVSMQTGSGRFLVQVKSIRSLKRGGLKINSRLIIQDRSKKGVHIRATHFASNAGRMSAAKLADFYVQQAEKQFAKVWK